MAGVTWSEYSWLNEPKVWSTDGDRLVITPDADTDFWRRSHYGFLHDSGHFFGMRMVGDLFAEARFDASFREKYDQAGLMIRVDEEHWVKAGVEFVDGEWFASAVVTNRYSDWSVTRLARYDGGLWIRVLRRGEAIDVLWSEDGTEWEKLRLGYLAAGPSLVGPMTCAPIRAGFSVVFSSVTIRALAPDEPFGH